MRGRLVASEMGPTATGAAARLAFVQLASARTLRRSLLLAILAVAVAGMHHLAGPSAHIHRNDHAAPISHAARAVDEAVVATHRSCHQRCPQLLIAPDGHDTPVGHDSGHLLHLCLAVLLAAAGFALMLIALGSHPLRRARVGGSTEYPMAFARPPPLPTSRRLACLCVLRL